MAIVDVTAATLVVHVTGLDRVLAFHGRLEIPLAHVSSVVHDPDDVRREVAAFQDETFIPGAVAPSSSLVGAFREHGDRIFWDVHHPEQAVTINLQHDKYAKIIVDVADPEATVQRLRQALAR